MLPGVASQLVSCGVVFGTATVKHNTSDTQEWDEENYAHHVYSGT